MSQDASVAAFVHAGALVIRHHGLVIRGASGSGKSALALGLLAQARQAGWFGRLVADDTLELRPQGGRVVARPHPRTAGLIERRGVGVVAVPYEPACVVHLVVDLVDAAALPRLPTPADAAVSLVGLLVRRRALPAGAPVSDNVYRVLDDLAAFRPSS